MNCAGIGRLAYIRELESGPTTSWDLVLSLGVSKSSVARMMKKLRDCGAVRSVRGAPGGHGNVRLHELIEGYEERAAIKRVQRPPHCIVTEELLHVARLRAEGLVGQRLHEKHIQTYPDRTYSSMRHMVGIARKQGLCR